MLILRRATRRSVSKVKYLFRTEHVRDFPGSPLKSFSRLPINLRLPGHHRFTPGHNRSDDWTFQRSRHVRPHAIVREKNEKFISPCGQFVQISSATRSFQNFLSSLYGWLTFRNLIRWHSRHLHYYLIRIQRNSTLLQSSLRLHISSVVASSRYTYSVYVCM